MDLTLLDAVLGAKSFQARAAAVHILADERDRIPGALDRFKKAANDEHPRVQTEAARALSFYPSADSMLAVVSIANKPMDTWVRYTVEHALAANESAWRSDYLAGRLTKGNPEADKMVDEIIKGSKTGGLAAPWIKLLLSAEAKSKEERFQATKALANMKGNPSKGREVFLRNCTACHKMGNGEGNDFGPNMDKVMDRLKTREKIIESIIDPNAEVDKKYLSTRIDRLNGSVVTGLVVSETKTEVVLFDGKEKRTIPVDDIDLRTVLKQSSMPEGQAGAMAPVEFLDLIEYLSSLK